MSDYDKSVSSSSLGLNTKPRPPRTIRDIIPPDKPFRRRQATTKGMTIIHVDIKGVIEGKGLPTARRGHRQKTASRAAFAATIGSTQLPVNDPFGSSLGNSLRSARLRQAEAEFRAMGR